MIKYHGTPFGGSKSEAAEALIGRHAFVSYAASHHLDVCLDVCQSIAIDNGAFSAWKSGKVIDWEDYYTWVEKYIRHPRLDFVIIPDEIEGDEEANYKLIAGWSKRFSGHDYHKGVPVWHMHESNTKLSYLAQSHQRVAIGSSAEFSQVGSPQWHERMRWVMRILCDKNGQPMTKIHMLRGLDPDVFTKYPFHSADSTNAARNCNIKDRWIGTYPPPSNSWRARVIMARIEAFNSPERFDCLPDWLK